jgi:hypothetical protein
MLEPVKQKSIEDNDRMPFVIEIYVKVFEVSKAKGRQWYLRIFVDRLGD